MERVDTLSLSAKGILAFWGLRDASSGGTEASPCFDVLPTCPLSSRPELIYLPPIHTRPRQSKASSSARETTRGKAKKREGPKSAGFVKATRTDRGCFTAATMVVLTEEFHGLSLKRKGADEPELFGAGAAAGFPLSCRATKMRRLACPDNCPHRRLDEPAVGAGAVAAATAQDDVPMGDDAAAAPYPVSGGAGGGDEKALVVYHGDAPRSAPRVAFRAHADWVHAMLREADSRTVRELLLAGARGQGSDDLALAIVPWVAPAPSSAPEETEPSTAEEEEEATADDGDGSEGAAAMDVEGDEEEQGRPWTGQTYAAPVAAAEGFVYRWPQHCMAPPQMPTVAQASPVMWSW